jgi:hypothetical protein
MTPERIQQIRAAARVARGTTVDRWATLVLELVDALEVEQARTELRRQDAADFVRRVRQATGSWR